MEIIKFSDFLEGKHNEKKDYNLTKIAIIISIIFATFEVALGFHKGL